MTSDGGVITQAISSLRTKGVSPKDTIYIAGGDVLTTDWTTIIGHSSSHLTNNVLRVVRRLLGPSLGGRLAGRLYGSEFDFPFVFAPGDFPARPKVIYNAVGGSWFLKNAQHASVPRIVAKLSDATSISVREAQACAFLNERGVPAKLRPDSAACMSLMYDRDFLAQYRPEQLQDNPNYVVIQCALHVGRSELASIVQRATTLARHFDAQIVLLPIGTAPSHDDDKFLKLVEAELVQAGEKATLLPQMHIFQIMATIAGAKAYAGSSLHGAITSMSYGVPAAELIPGKVLKLAAYLGTWGTPAFELDGITMSSARAPAPAEAGQTQPQMALADLKSHFGIA